jgi:stage V sporulation protein R
MSYEEMQKGYEYGQHRVSELVINTSPCYIYCLSSNTMVDNVMVIAHALGHNDFFKNNIHFAYTDTNMMNKMANNGSRIRRHMDRRGKEAVTEFIDYVLRLDNLIDPALARQQRECKTFQIKDKRSYHFPRRFPVDGERDYMEEWINTKGWRNKENERIREVEAAEQLELFKDPTRDILGYLRDHAPLKRWQADIIAMLHEEAMYFAPQIITKTLNEGWASVIDYKMMAEEGLVTLGQPEGTSGIIEYARHKMNVLGGKYSANPYKLGYCLLKDIEDRWDKGKFGDEWNECDNMRERENWDKKLGLGKEKMFEVRKHYDDFMFVNEFFTEDFCNEYEFFEWERTPAGEYVIASRDHKKIKKKLIRQFLHGGKPDIKLVDPNHRSRGWFLLEHNWNGLPLHLSYARGAICAMQRIWNNTVVLSSRNANEEEIVFICGEGDSEDSVTIMPREEYESTKF